MTICFGSWSMRVGGRTSRRPRWAALGPIRNRPRRAARPSAHRIGPADVRGDSLSPVLANPFPVIDEHVLCRSGHLVAFDDDRRRIERQLEGDPPSFTNTVGMAPAT